MLLFDLHDCGDPGLTLSSSEGFLLDYLYAYWRIWATPLILGLSAIWNCCRVFLLAGVLMSLMLPIEFVSSTLVYLKAEYLLPSALIYLSAEGLGLPLRLLYRSGRLLLIMLLYVVSDPQSESSEDSLTSFSFLLFSCFLLAK